MSNEIYRRIRRDYFPGRSPELVVTPQRPNYFGGFIGTSHSGPWDYIQKVPIVFYGPGFISPRGRIEVGREVTLADIAPTVAELLGTSFPRSRPGTAIDEALVPAEARLRPKLVVVVVWDGGGTNVLRAWPHSWPNLRRLMRGGTAILDATVGSSPSNTPPAHTNIGTGAFPNQHGIVDIDIRRGGDTIDSFDGLSARYLEIPTFADLYDAGLDNRPLVGMFGYSGWHLGMMGAGAESGDKDIAALLATQGDRIVSSSSYRLPSYVNSVPGLEDDVRTIDAEDGEIDSAWLGHPVLDDPFEIKHTPAWLLHQTRVIEQILEREGFGADDVPDLFFTNYKAIDLIGHRYNMLSKESESAVRYSDSELGKLETILNRTVGRESWAMIVTADHGQTPMAEATGAWPIDMTELVADASRSLGVGPRELFDRTRPGHFWVNRDVTDQAGIDVKEISRFLLTYTIADNASSRRPVPPSLESKRGAELFTAAWMTEDNLWACSRP
jgi:hypothetical protein